MLLPPSFSICPVENPAPRYAAEELSRYLARMTGGAYPITESAEGFALHMQREDALPSGAFHLSVQEGGIGLSASSPGGFVYGAYALLEKLGCGFFAPDCERVPEGPLHLPLGEVVETPAFFARELFWREAMEGAFAVKLRLNSARSSITEEMGGKMMFYNFTHTFYQLVPDTWFDTHPEYFSMVEGKRLKDKSQLCLTNPDVLRLVVEGVLQWKKDNPAYTIFSVSMNDWYNNCQCPACHALDEQEGSAAGSMIAFVNQVAEAVEKKYPDVYIHTFAYLYCRKPPLHVKPRHNVIIRLCGIENCFAHPMDTCGCQISAVDVQAGVSADFHGNRQDINPFVEDLKGWAAICDNLYIWDYTTNYANYLQPFPNLKVLQANLQLFQKNGVKGVFAQGNFAHGQTSALAQLKIYLLGKLLWNPDTPLDGLIHAFCHGYYGPAGDVMTQYALLWKEAAGQHHASIYDPPTAPYLDDDTLSQANKLMEQAETLAAQQPFNDRVQREKLSLRYVTLARQALDTSGRDAAIDAFAQDARRLGITEVFERKAFDASIDFLKKTPLRVSRLGVQSISYPL